MIDAKSKIKPWQRLLAHPLTRGLDLDDPETTRLRRRIIKEKSFLRRLYQEWYSKMVGRIPGDGSVLEIGSGAGFFADFLPRLIRSDVVFWEELHLLMDGARIPIVDGGLSGIVMVDVLHHMPCPRKFLAEAVRTLRPDGVVVMVEPWVTPWSTFVYSKLHHEPFRPDAASWEFEASGPLSSANGAMAWMIFDRDRDRFLEEFPAFAIQALELMMPFRYLVSGGISLRGLAPGWTFGLWRRVEKGLEPWMNKLAMFAMIVLRRK